MEYKILTSRTASGLTEKVTTAIAEGWKPTGSHKVRIDREFKRFSGNQHRDTIIECEYSQTIIKT
jgi:hypothetical protein